MSIESDLGGCLGSQSPESAGCRIRVGTPQVPSRTLKTRVPGLRPSRTSETSKPDASRRARARLASRTRKERPQSWSRSELRTGFSSASPLSGDECAAIFGLDHAVVRTANAEAAKELYGGGLGLRLALDRTFPQWGARLLFFRVGDITLEVTAALTPDSGEADEKPVLSSDRDQLWGLSFRVRDADRARARLGASGFDVSEVREGRKPGTRVFSVRDGTCGVPTLILQPADAGD